MKTLVLAGSGEFTAAMNEVDTHLLSHISTPDPQVAILPTAAGQEHDAVKWIDKGITHYERLRIKSFGIPVLKREDAENVVHIRNMSKASLIYFSGGDPGYLLESVKDTTLIDFTLTQYKKGIALAGSSAGAMVCGSIVLSNIQKLGYAGVMPEWKSALALVPYIVFPHFDLLETKYPEMMEKAFDSMEKNAYTDWLGIDEDTALITKNTTEAQVMGKGRVVVVKNGKRTEYKKGEIFTV